MSKALIRRLFFTDTLSVRAAGGAVRVQGVFLNFFGRNLPEVFMATWALLVLLFVGIPWPA